MKLLLEAPLVQRPKRNIDSVLGAVAKGHEEATTKPRAKTVKPKVEANKRVMGSFLFSQSFLNEVRRQAMTWREEGLPASLAREGAVLEALAKVTLSNPALIQKALKIAEAGRRGED